MCERRRAINFRPRHYMRPALISTDRGAASQESFLCCDRLIASEACEFECESTDRWNVFEPPDLIFVRANAAAVFAVGANRLELKMKHVERERLEMCGIRCFYKGEHLVINRMMALVPHRAFTKGQCRNASPEMRVGSIDPAQIVEQFFGADVADFLLANLAARID